MPVYDVDYVTRSFWTIRIEADSVEDALRNWRDPAYWVWDQAEYQGDELIDDVSVDIVSGDID